MKRVPILAVLAIILTFVAHPARAQETADKTRISITETERLLETLKDDARRKAFIADLEGFVAAQHRIQAASEKSAGTRLLELVSDKMAATGARLAELANHFADIPALTKSVIAYFGDPKTQTIWLTLLAHLAMIFASGLVAEWLVKLALRRARQSIEAQTPGEIGVALLFSFLRTLLDLAAVAAFVAAAYLAMTLLAPLEAGRVLALALINANAIVRIVLSLARMFLAPHTANIRVLPIQDEAANYALIWIRRLIFVIAYGYFLTEVLPVLGVPPAIHALTAKIVGLVLALMVIVLVLQNRHEVAAKIHSTEGQLIGQLRRRLADVWHLVVIVYVSAIYGVWLLEVPGGFEYVMQSSGLSLLVIAMAHVLFLLLRQALEKLFSLSDEQKEHFPNLEARVNRYFPVLNTAARILLYGAAVLAVLSIWGLDAVGWMTTPTGSALVKGFFNIAAIILIALVVWELLSAAVERYLTAQDSEGNAIARGQRAMTLLPLLRNAVLIALAVLVTITVLSEIGVNIGPLIAGAGILGLAIGFGAQTLVKDVITGFFILIEDSVAVGDLVVIGNYRGKVEAMSIRSIQLRDLRGDVHRIPFSEVTTTTNRSKIFSYASFDIGVAYREDIDHCMNVIREVGAEMRQDENFSSTILEDIEIMGVQSFDDSAVVIRARIKVVPGKQLGIQRAFNRLIKNRFDAEGIEIPFPHRTIYFGVDSQGNAPPAHLELRHAEQSGEPARRPKSALVKPPEGESADFDSGPPPETGSEQS